jgi:hypothetical protein
MVPLRFILIICILQLISVEGKRRFEVVQLDIPWPSGIQVDRMVDSQGRIYRFGRLQHNAITLRPHWSAIRIEEGILSTAESADIVKKAEDYAERFGWSKGRHVDYDIRPTKDLPVEVIFESDAELQALHDRFRERLLPRIAQEFGLDAARIRPTDLFITKYSASSETERLLGPHQDKSPWSFVIALNDAFEGGGTYFYDARSLWQAPVGAAVYFNGVQLHGANPITAGTRYIMAGFCEYGDDVPIESAESHAAFMAVYDPLFDGYAGQAGFRSGDLIVGIEVCEVAPQDNSCEVSSDSVACKEDTGFRRRRQDITDATSDEDWVRFAQSCENLDPGSNTIMWVRRKVK